MRMNIEQRRSLTGVPAIVAGAGGSSRCPEGKLLKLWRGRPLLEWLLETLSDHPGVGERFWWSADTIACGSKMS